MEMPHTAFKVLCLLTENSTGLCSTESCNCTRITHRLVAGTRHSVKARTVTSSWIPTARCRVFFSLFFFFQIHPRLATVIPHLDSCNSDVTGIMITLISQTLSVIPLSWDAPPTPSSSLANISWCFRTQLRCHLLLETFPYLLRLNLVLLLSLLVCVGVHMHAHARALSLAFLTPWTVAHRVPLSMEFPGKSTGVSSHFFLQGIFPTQGSSPHLLHLLHL